MDGETADSLKVFTPVEEEKDAEKSKEFKKKTEELERRATEEEEAEEAEADKHTQSSAAPLSEETQAAATLPGDAGIGSAAGKTESGNQEERTPRQQAAANTLDPLAPLETILHMPPPENLAEENAAKPPHLQTPPYVHHFDTYTLVREVQKGGFTSEQAVTSMKALRGLLALNLDVAKAGLVSKYDVENVRFAIYPLS